MRRAWENIVRHRKSETFREEWVRRETTSPRGKIQFMKKYIFLLLAAALCAPAFSADKDQKKMTPAEKKAAMLEKYDTNKNGRLDPEEKTKMKEELKKAKEEAKEARKEAQKEKEAAESSEE